MVELILYVVIKITQINMWFYVKKKPQFPILNPVTIRPQKPKEVRRRKICIELVAFDAGGKTKEHNALETKYENTPREL